MGNTDNPVVENYWKAVPDSQIIALSNIYSGEQDVTYDVPTGFANHIVEIHNAWWDNKVWATYYDNIMVDYDREMIEWYEAEIRNHPYYASEDATPGDLDNR